MVSKICPECGAPFSVPAYRRDTAKTCSKVCDNNRRKHAPTKPEAERFWPKVHKTDSCWLWTAATDNHGYGVFFYNKHLIKAHRAAWLLFGLVLQPEDCLLHVCDTPLCVNPSHLFIGSRRENMQDKIQKGRQHYGSQVHSSKCTEDMARAIYNDPRAQKEIAADYGLHPSTISYIKTGKTWRHATYKQTMS